MNISGFERNTRAIEGLKDRDDWEKVSSHPDNKPFIHTLYHGGVSMMRLKEMTVSTPFMYSVSVLPKEDVGGDYHFPPARLFYVCEECGTPTLTEGCVCGNDTAFHCVSLVLRDLFIRRTSDYRHPSKVGDEIIKKVLSQMRELVEQEVAARKRMYASTVNTKGVRYFYCIQEARLETYGFMPKYVSYSFMGQGAVLTPKGDIV